MTRSVVTVGRAGLTTLLLALFIPGTALAQADEPTESLYERLGGLPAIALVISDFMDDFMDDPLIMSNPAVRERKTAETAPYIEYQVITMVCEATGGPCSYSGLDMAAAHDGLNVSAEEWERMVEIFAGTLAARGVGEAEQEELFAILGPLQEDIVAGDDG